MTVASTSRKVVYSANDLTTSWPITFPYYDTTAGSDIKLYLTPSGGADQLIDPLNYTVDVINDRVIYPTVASGLPPIATGNTITLARSEDFLQATHLTTQGPFVAANIESALDKITMELQEHKETLERTIQYPISQTPSSTDTTDFLNTVLEAKTNAQDSATASATSASDALSSANTAATYATGLNATSTSSNSIETGAKTFTTQANKTFSAGQFIMAVDSSNNANYMFGQVTSYSSTTLVIDSQVIGGSGTKTSWSIYIVGARGATGAAGANGTNGSQGPAGASTVRGTFTNGDLTAGVLTITHNGALASPYVLNVYVYNNSGALVFPDAVNTFTTNSCKVDLTSYGTLTGTWSYSYVLQRIKMAQYPVGKLNPFNDAKISFPGFQRIKNFIAAGGESAFALTVDGDTDKEYRVVARNTNASKEILILLNNDAVEANYGRQYLFNQSGTISAARGTQSPRDQISGMCEWTILTPPGLPKIIVNDWMYWSSGTTVTQTMINRRVWNSTANVTSLNFMHSSGTFTADTHIVVFARRA